MMSEEFVVYPRRRKLDLRDSPRTVVFRAIDQHLRADPVIGRVVKTFRSWKGGPEDRLEFSLNHAPAIRLSPQPGPVEWWTPDIRKGTLDVNVEILVSGCCVDDLDNLWNAIELSLDPIDPLEKSAFVQSLRSIGVWQATIIRSSPTYDARPEAGSDGLFHGAGQLSVSYQYKATP